MTQQRIAKAPIFWSVTVALSVITLVSLIIVPWYGIAHGYSGTAWLFFVIFLFWNGIGIGSGYHRLWSHRTYDAHWLVRLFLALGGAQALQNSILTWCARHRDHHKHVDDNLQDPYSINNGFWFAHIGWMCRKYDSSRSDLDNVRDLQRDPIARLQHRWYFPLTWLLNLGLPAAIGYATGEFWGMILLAGFLRVFVNLQVTFFVNSLAHCWGKRPYTEENTARDSWLVALMTYGEGWHNYHHKFQTDYRNGIRWYQYDLNKWFISVCSWLGLARNLKRVPKFKVLRAKLMMEFERAQSRMSQGLGDQSWKQTIELEYQQFLETIGNWQSLQVERMQQQGQQLKRRWETTALRTRLKELEYRLKMQRKRVMSLSAALVS